MAKCLIYLVVRYVVLFTVSKSKPHVCIQNLQKGLQLFGLQYIFLEFFITSYLLQLIAKKLYVKDLTCLLTPQFSEEGRTKSYPRKKKYTRNS